MYKHLVESIKETNDKMFVSLEEKTKFNNYENTMRRKDDSYSKTEVDNKVKELSDNTYGTVEGTRIVESNTLDGYIKDLEILGNTVQNQDNLADIKSVGILQEDGTYKMSIVSCGKNLITGELKHSVLDVVYCENIFLNKNVKYTITSKNVDIGNAYIAISKKTNHEDPLQRISDFTENIRTFSLNDTLESGYYNLIFWKAGISNTENGFIQLEEGTVATSYEPYKESRVEITLPCQLEKVGNISDRLYYDEEEKAWCIEKNINKIELNKCTRIIDCGNSFFDVRFQLGSEDKCITTQEGFVSCGICSLTYKNMAYNISSEGGCIYIHGNGTNEIILGVSKSNATTLVEVNNYLKGKYLYYQLATPEKIILPLSTQIQLNSYANKTHIYTVSGDIEGTIKATLPKSLGASVQTLNDKTDMMIDRIKNVETLKEGQNLSYESDKGYVVCENTNNGQIDNIKIEGMTLVNVIQNKSWIIGGSIHGDLAYMPVTWDMLKPNTYYTYYIFNPPVNMKLDEIYIGTNFTQPSLKYNNKPILIQTGSDVSNTGTWQPHIYVKDKQGTLFTESMLTQTKLILIEGDYTNYHINFFEGLISTGEDVEKIDIISQSESNLFNKDTVIYNKRTNTVNGNLVTDTLYVTSDLIKVKPNKEYVSTHLPVVTFYDKYNNFISCIDSSLTPQYFITPKDCEYIRVRNWARLRTLEEKNSVISQNIVSYADSGILTSDYKTHKSLLYYNDLGELVPVPCLHKWDSVEKHSDGKYYYHKRSHKLVLDGSESNWVLSGYQNQVQCLSADFFIRRTDIDEDKQLNSISDTFSCSSSNYNDEEMVFVKNHFSKQEMIILKIERTKLSTEDLTGIKTWLQSNPVTVVYESAEEQVYECVNLNLDTYDNETMVMVNSGAISPKISFEVSSHIGNTVSILRERLKAIEEEYTNYKLTQDRLLLSNIYAADKGSFGVNILAVNSFNARTISDIDLFELTKSVIEVGLDNYNIVSMEELIDFYTIIGKFDYYMADILFEMIENQINPPVIEIPEEEISILPEI